MKRATLVPAIILTGVCASATIVRAQTPNTTHGDLPSDVRTEALERLTYSSYRPAGWDLYLYAPPGSEPRRLTDHPALDYDAAFSPDGRWLAFVSTHGGDADIYLLPFTPDSRRRSTPDRASGISCGISHGRRVRHALLRRPVAATAPDPVRTRR